MKNHYDIIIIGGGVVGNSIAYHLSERQEAEVLVIDKSFPLSGTSGSTQAWVWVHNKTPSWYGEFSMYSAELYPYLARKIGDVEYRRTGGLSPLFSEGEVEKAKRMAEEQAKVGIQVKVLSRDEVLEIEPALSPNIAGATYSRIDGNVNPFRVVDLFMRAAKKNGVDYSFYNRVVQIDKVGEKYQITTEKGKYTAQKLVLAVGPWSKELGKMVGIHVPIRQIRGQIIITEPLAPLLNHTISCMRQANNGEVLIGYSMEDVGYNRSSTLEVIQETANLAVRLVPALARANIVRSFSGIRAMPEDGLPIIGEVPGKKNLYIAVMHSGVTLSPLVGTLMTELMIDGEPSISIEPYSLKRFM